MELCALLLGDGAVGKSALVGSILTKEFHENGLEDGIPNQKRIKSGGSMVDLTLIDTTGEDDSDRLRVNSYPKADVILLCFSIISPFSYENLKTKWMPEINRYAHGKPVILLGLKSDLRTDPDALARLSSRRMTPVSFNQGLRMQQELNAAAYIECSAKDMSGIDEIVEALISAKFPKQGKLKKRTGSKKCDII